VLNDLHTTYISREELVTEPEAWCVVEYTKSPSARAEATLHLRTTRSATAHGIVLWFDTQLFGDIGFSCAPGYPDTIYGHTFLPWLQPVAVSAGQEIQVELHADLVGRDYVWRWETRVCEERKGVLHHFRQSTLEGALLSPQLLRRHATDFIPVLSEAGVAERWLLEAMDGKTPIEEIASAATERFPNVFRRQQEALRRATELAKEFSR
jgi:protein arginine N-methyltransferase 1